MANLGECMEETEGTSGGGFEAQGTKRTMGRGQVSRQQRMRGHEAVGADDSCVEEHSYTGRL